NGKFTFAIAQDCGLDNQMRALTPTYAPAFLGQTPAVTVPIGWSTALVNLQGRTPYIRFKLRARTLPAALRISPARNFGPLQVGRWEQGTLVVQNIGGPDLEVRSVAFTPTSANPGDFSFVVAGDPVDMPLPIEGT